MNNVAQLFADEHIAARENIIAIADEELGGPVRMQNVVGKLSGTPGRIDAAGPPLGQHNREILIAELGYSESELAAAGLSLAPVAAQSKNAAAAEV